MARERAPAAGPTLLAAALAVAACRSGEAAFPAMAANQPPPPPGVAGAVALEVVASGLDQPLALTFAPGDPRKRLFVVEKTGRVRVLHSGRVAAAPYLDLSARVSRGDEQGLLGLAFHPRHAATGRLYVNLTDLEGHTNVLELRAAPGGEHVEPSSERRILFVRQPYSNHNGGHVAFGPEGKLYVGLGDGGAAGDPHGNGQNPRALLGKMLRIDVDARGVPVPEIIQTGLRNPWRYAFDRKTGDLYIADVGQDIYEEIHVAAAGRLEGLNFGWNIREGNHCFRRPGCESFGLVPAVLEYTHAAGCSVTGGFVYRGAAIPEIHGAYFYADYCTGLLRSFRWRDGRVSDSWDWKPALDPRSRLARLTSFGEDESGELYLLSQDGPIYKLVRSRTGAHP